MRNFKKRLINKEHQKYIESYINNLRRLNKSEHTIRNYYADLEKFFHWLDHNKKISIHKVNGDIIGEYKEFLLKGGAIYRPPSENQRLYLVAMFSTLFLHTFFKKRTRRSILFFQNAMSVNSRRRHLSSLKNFFEFLKQTHEDHSNKFLKNPVKNKIHSITLKDVDVDNTKLLTCEEFEKTFEKTYRTKERLLLQLLYFGGMRLSEVCFLKIMDFDFESQSITFIRKGGSRHKLFIQNADEIFKNLQFYLSQEVIQSEYVFHNKKGAPLSLKTMYNLIMAILNRAEIRREITPHSFRKACATNLYLKTKDLLMVRDYLNHSDAKVTQTYIETKHVNKIDNI